MTEPGAPTATRKNLQLGRRLFHAASGVAVAMTYGFFFTHAQAVQLLGTIACVAYVFDRVRTSYPEIAKQAEGVTNFFLRAEERLEESSMVPYAIALLLTIISLPKPIALMAILTLALADPLSAIVGIRYGKRHIVTEKTVEGSAAFFGVAFLCSCFILFRVARAGWDASLGTSLLISASATAFEMLPIKLDDNLTIPLFVGFIAWVWCGIVGVAV